MSSYYLAADLTGNTGGTSWDAICHRLAAGEAVWIVNVELHPNPLAAVMDSRDNTCLDFACVFARVLSISIQGKTHPMCVLFRK